MSLYNWLVEKKKEKGTPIVNFNKYDFSNDLKIYFGKNSKNADETYVWINTLREAGLIRLHSKERIKSSAKPVRKAIFDLFKKVDVSFGDKSFKNGESAVNSTSFFITMTSLTNLLKINPKFNRAGVGFIGHILVSIILKRLYEPGKRIKVKPLHDLNYKLTIYNSRYSRKSLENKIKKAREDLIELLNKVQNYLHSQRDAVDFYTLFAEIKKEKKYLKSYMLRYALEILAIFKSIEYESKPLGNKLYDIKYGLHDSTFSPSEQDNMQKMFDLNYAFIDNSLNLLHEEYAIKSNREFPLSQRRQFFENYFISNYYDDRIMTANIGGVHRDLVENNVFSHSLSGRYVNIIEYLNEIRKSILESKKLHGLNINISSLNMIVSYIKSNSSLGNYRNSFKILSSENDNMNYINDEIGDSEYSCKNVASFYKEILHQAAPLTNHFNIPKEALPYEKGGNPNLLPKLVESLKSKGIRVNSAELKIAYWKLPRESDVVKVLDAYGESIEATGCFSFAMNRKCIELICSNNKGYFDLFLELMRGKYRLLFLYKVFNEDEELLERFFCDATIIHIDDVRGINESLSMRKMTVKEKAVYERYMDRSPLTHSDIYKSIKAYGRFRLKLEKLYK